MERASRCGLVLGRSGRKNLQGRQPPYKTVPVLGVDDPSGPAAPPRYHLPRRSLYAAEADEGSGKTRLHPVLYLFHLAHAALGAGAISDRADPLSRPPFLSPELLRHYARYPPLSFPDL